MTATVIQTKEVKAIDWSKPTLLESIETKAVVISNGVHIGDYFHGTILHGGKGGSSVGELSKSLVKEYFIPAIKPITITFSND